MVRVGVTYRFEQKLEPYVHALRCASLDPAPICPPGETGLRELQGLLITGGTDLNPSLYGCSPHPEEEPPDDARDAMELRLLREALDSQLPVLCICRGMQLFNVAHGGALFQHLAETPVHRRRGITDAHLLNPCPGTRLAGIVGEAPFSVNSRHHQAVSRVGGGLVASAHSGDGIIEGLELPGQPFAIAVQWHPEDRVPSHLPDTLLFQAFARACGL
jgi:gamma-glutamyl-gamma-aminobutyrate hydrolase PuuD